MTIHKSDPINDTKKVVKKPKYTSTKKIALQKGIYNNDVQNIMTTLKQLSDFTQEDAFHSFKSLYETSNIDDYIMFSVLSHPQEFIKFLRSSEMKQHKNTNIILTVDKDGIEFLFNKVHNTIDEAVCFKMTIGDGLFMHYYRYDKPIITSIQLDSLLTKIPKKTNDKINVAFNLKFIDPKITEPVKEYPDYSPVFFNLFGITIITGVNQAYGYKTILTIQPDDINTSRSSILQTLKQNHLIDIEINSTANLDSMSSFFENAKDSINNNVKLSIEDNKLILYANLIDGGTSEQSIVIDGVNTIVHGKLDSPRLLKYSALKTYYSLGSRMKNLVLWVSEKKAGCDFIGCQIGISGSGIFKCSNNSSFEIGGFTH